MKKAMPVGRRGFTFVELLVSITIIAVLTAIGIASYTQTTKKSRDTRRRADIESIRSGLELYRSEQGSYPVLATDGSQCLTATQINDPVSGVIYLNPIPTDPKSNPPSFCYKYTRTATTYTLTCTFEAGGACSYVNP